jgi:hypothetical protein
MKKLIFPLALVVIMTAGCKNEKQAEFTILGDGTQYSNSPEIMIGKVKSVIEKNYWAIRDGDSFKKGNPLTKADRDSIGGWTDDFEALFDADGHVTVCTGLDEAGNPAWKNESLKENNLIVKRNFFRKDTLSFYDHYKYGENGFLTGGLRFRARVDTLMLTANVKTNSIGYPTEFQLFNSKGVSAEKYVFTYDDQNRFLNFKSFDKDGKFKSSYEVKYNDKSKVSELTIGDKDNKITDANYFTYEYDAKGNWVRAIVKDLKNRIIIEERSYKYFD